MLDAGESEPQRALPAAVGRAGIRLAAALMALLVMASIGGALALQRSQALDEAAALSARRAGNLAGELGAALAVAAAAVQHIEARLTQLPPGEPAAGVLAALSAEQRPLLAALPQPLRLVALGADGRPLYADAAAPVEAETLPAADGWQVGLTRGAAGRRSVPVLRRAAPNQQGVAAFVVELDHGALVARLESQREPPGGGAALFRIEADVSTTLLARAPLVEAEIGRRLRGPLATALERSRQGWFNAPVLIDGERRTVAYRRLDGELDELVVAYGMAQNQVLADWHALLPWGAGVALLLLGGITAGARRLEMAQQAQADQLQVLQRSENQFRALANNLPDVVVRFDQGGRHLYANPAVEEATGLQPLAFIGKTNSELGMPGVQVEQWTSCLRRVFASGRPERLEFDYPGPDGQRHWESLVVLEPLPPGAEPTALVISRDITERRRLLQVLQDRENRYRLLFERNPMPMWVYGRGNLRLLAVNDAFCQHYGYSAEEALAMRLPDFYPADERDAIVALVATLEGHAYVGEWHHLKKDGSLITIEARSHNIEYDGRSARIAALSDISDRKAAEQALQLSEQRLREAQQLAAIGSWELDLRSGEVHWSDEVFRIFEIDPARVGASYEAFIAAIHPDDRAAFDRAYRQSVAEHSDYNVAHRLLLPDGRIKHVRDQGRSFYADDGTPLRSAGTVLDITARLQAEQALRESEASHREMFERNPHPMWVYDLDTLAFLAVNDAAIHHYGYSRDEFLRMTLKDIRPTEDVQRLLANVRKVTDGYDDAGSWRHRTKDGRLLEVEISSHTMHFEGRAAELVLAHDVTRRNQAERSVRDNEQRLRLALQAAHQGLYDLDLRTGEALVSPEYATMLGYDPADFHETNAAWRERLHPEDRAQVEQAYLDYVAGRRADYSVEFRQRTREGGWKWILSVGRIQERDAQGQPLRLLGTHTDMTAIKQAQAALLDSEARFRVLFDASPVPTLAYERGSLRLLAVNEAFSQLYGYGRDEALALRIPDLYPPEQRAAMVELAARVKGLNHVTHIQHLRKDGRRIDVETRSHDFTVDGRPGRISVIVDITEQRRAEAERRAAAERFEILFEAAPEAMSVSTFDCGRFLQVNEAFCSAFGHPREQVLGRTSLELQIWTDTAAREAIVQRLSAGEPVRGFEAVARRGDGQAIDLLLSAERIEFDGQDAVLLMFRDISERKRLDAALRASQARLVHLLSRAPTVVYTARAQGDFGATYYSPNLSKLLGWEPQSFVGDSGFWLDHVHPDDRDALLQQMDALANRDELVMEYRFQHADGSWRWMRDHVSVQRDERAAAVELVGAWIDITERREAEEQVRRLAAELEQRVQERTAQLAQSESRYRTIFDTVPISIGEEDWSAVQSLLRDLRRQGVTDGAGFLAARPDFVHDCLRAVKVRRLNQKALALHEATSQGADLPDLLAFYPKPEDQTQFVGELEAMWSGQRLFTAKRTLPSVTGRPLSLMMSMSLPRLDDDDGTALVCLVDITEIDRLNAELDLSVERLRKVNKELETFTYSVSHDLKAPLRGIDGYSRLLLSEHADRLDDEARQFLQHIRQATQHMGALIDDLLAYSRLERRDVALAPLPLAAVVDAVLAGFRQHLDGVQIEVTVDPALQARADSQGLTMALRNLVDNAVKFSRASAPPRIAITATRSTDGIELAVHDNGVGFDMKFHDRIFSIFQRLHRAEEYPGTGIGLAIVRKAMERMGGHVRARSLPGEGATFTLQLPEASPP